jgi:hypothetical protein
MSRELHAVHSLPSNACSSGRQKVVQFAFQIRCDANSLILLSRFKLSAQGCFPQFQKLDSDTQNCIVSYSFPCPDSPQSISVSWQPFYSSVNEALGVCGGVGSAADLLPFEVCSYSWRFDAASYFRAHPLEVSHVPGVDGLGVGL